MTPCYFKGGSDIESGAPSGVPDVVATVGAQEIIGEGSGRATMSGFLRMREASSANATSRT